MLHLRPHPELHPVFEALAYAAGYGLYKFLRSRAGDVIEEQQRWSVIAAAMLGALVGSRALGLLEQAPRMHITLAQAFLPGGGKTIVGGLLGGWIAVEVVKRFQHIHNPSARVPHVYPRMCGETWDVSPSDHRFSARCRAAT
jgi:prolipoprotein diacylglyceryltransferase